MKTYKKMILTYINKYENMNFEVLSKELKLPMNSLLGIVDELLLKGYITCTDQRIMVTEKGKAKVYDSWNQLTTDSQEDEEEFQWEELYIPENFLEKL